MVLPSVIWTWLLSLAISLLFFSWMVRVVGVKLICVHFCLNDERKSVLGVSRYFGLV